MLAYHSDNTIKTNILLQLEAHRAADQLAKGRYWEGGKGCAVGCTVHSGDHSEYERRFGIPQVLARLEDRIFEGLPNELSQVWPIRFMSVIEPGADLAMVWPRFALWLLTEEVPQHTKNVRTKASLAEVAELYRQWTEGNKPEREVWIGTRRNVVAVAADYVAAYAAYAVAAADNYAATAYAAYAVAYAAYAATYTDADAATYTDADAAYARGKCYIRMSDKLIELLSQCVAQTVTS